MACLRLALDDGNVNSIQLKIAVCNLHFTFKSARLESAFYSDRFVNFYSEYQRLRFLSIVNVTSKYAITVIDCIQEVFINSVFPLGCATSRS